MNSLLQDALAGEKLQQQLNNKLEESTLFSLAERIFKKDYSDYLIFEPRTDIDPPRLKIRDTSLYLVDATDFDEPRDILNEQFRVYLGGANRSGKCLGIVSSLSGLGSTIKNQLLKSENGNSN